MGPIFIASFIGFLIFSGSTLGGAGGAGQLHQDLRGAFGTGELI
jgi:hypothetical protein